MCSGGSVDSPNEMEGTMAKVVSLGESRNRHGDFGDHLTLVRDHCSPDTA